MRVKLLITGDYVPHDRTIDFLADNNYGKIFGDFVDIVNSCDFSIINLEAPICSIDTPIQKTGPNLRVPQSAIDALKWAGFNAVTLANNHIMDYGANGLRETIGCLDENKILYVGAGKGITNIENTLIIEMKDCKIAIVNFCENEFSTICNDGYAANAIDPVKNYYQIYEAKKDADFVIVITHSGHEYYSLPSPRMQALFRFYVDLGADAVINHHTHCFSGYEKYNGCPIFYSTGNFSFDWNGKRNSVWNEGLGVSLFIEKGKSIEFEITPFKQGGYDAAIKCLEGEEKERFFATFERFNAIIRDSKQLEEQFEMFVSKRSSRMILALEPYENRILKFLRIMKIIPSFVSKKKKVLLSNLVRCESHRDILTRILIQKNNQV